MHLPCLYFFREAAVATRLTFPSLLGASCLQRRVRPGCQRPKGGSHQKTRQVVGDKGQVAESHIILLLVKGGKTNLLYRE